MYLSSATQKPLKSSFGFSLIEILIAMAIMGVMIGVAIPYLSGSADKYAKEEANRLVAALEMVRDMAIIENKEYGLTIDEKGYHFLVLNDLDEDRPPRWESVSEPKGLAEYEFPDTVEVNVAIDGENIFKRAEDDVDIFEEDVDIFEEEEEEEKVEPPQIYFLSTGEQNEFSIAIAAADSFQSSDDELRFFRVQGKLTGELLYQGPLPGNLFNDIERDFTDYLERE